MEKIMNKALKAVILCYMCFCSCKGTSEKTKVQAEDVSESITVSMDDVGKSTGAKEIPVFSNCKNYDNNLSTIASDVNFVLLDVEPPINEFQIYDIELSGDYIFLSGMYSIIVYDRQGKYIRNIGSKGMGPEEFIQLNPPLQLDRKNKLVYALDVERQRVVIYHFDGTYKGAFPMKEGDCIAIIDSSLIALRQNSVDRYTPESPSIRFVDFNGKGVKTYRSNLYPVSRSKMEHFGPDASFLWENRGEFYYLEYGADTIYKIEGSDIIPKWRVTGDLKLKKEELFKRGIGHKLVNVSYILRPNAGVFESDTFIIFKLDSDYERFYMVYGKQTGRLHRTYYDRPEIISNRRGDVKKMDYFIDDIVSGLHFNPQYQSMGRAIALVPAETVVNNRNEILKFIASHPSDEGAKLKSIIESMDEFDNPLAMMVAFK